MRVVLDTNIIVSSLIAPAGKPAAIIDARPGGKFTLLTGAAHVDEFRATLQSHAWPNSSNHTTPAAWSTRSRNSPSEDIKTLPRVKRSPDPTDDFLLALSEAGNADYLVTCDKSALLALGRHKSHAYTKLVNSRHALASFPNPGEWFSSLFAVC